MDTVQKRGEVEVRLWWAWIRDESTKEIATRRNKRAKAVGGEREAGVESGASSW